MAGKRNTLHKTHLEPFKDWLREVVQIPYRDGKGSFQVMQVLTPEDGWQTVFYRIHMPEHFSVNEKLMPIIHDFYRYRKQNWTERHNEHS